MTIRKNFETLKYHIKSSFTFTMAMNFRGEGENLSRWKKILF